MSLLLAGYEVLLFQKEDEWKPVQFWVNSSSFDKRQYHWFGRRIRSRAALPAQHKIKKFATENTQKHF